MNQGYSVADAIGPLRSQPFASLLWQAYIYRNKADGQWWIDEPSGDGVYVAPRTAPLPPTGGWRALKRDAITLPQLEVTKG